MPNKRQLYLKSVYLCFYAERRSLRGSRLRIKELILNKPISQLETQEELLSVYSQFTTLRTLKLQFYFM